MKRKTRTTAILTATGFIAGFLTALLTLQMTLNIHITHRLEMPVKTIKK